jgi:RND family efflux transporter MFP subunit
MRHHDHTLRIALLAVSALGLAACGGAEGSDQAKAAHGAAAAAADTPFAAIAAGKVDIEGGLVDVAARQPGIVMQVLVQEGDEVKKDQVLARLDDQEARLARNRAAADYAAAQAQGPVLQTQLDAARRELTRVQTLEAQHFVSPQRVETAQDAVRNAENQFAAQQASIGSARAALDEANYVVEQHVVRAPDDGRIVRRYANPGSGASTLQVTPLFQLQPRAPRIVRAELEERSLSDVHPGMAVQIVPEGDQSKSYPGSVIRIAEVFGSRKLQSDDPSKQTDERVVEVVVNAEQAQVLVGQRVLVKFMKDGATAPAAPHAG